MVTRTGLEAASFRALMMPDEVGRSRERSSTEPAGAASQAANGPNAPARGAGITALAAYLEAVGRLAGEAATRGNIALARDLLAEAGRVAAAISADDSPGSAGTAKSQRRPASGHQHWTGLVTGARGPADDRRALFINRASGLPRCSRPQLLQPIADRSDHFARLSA